MRANAWVPVALMLAAPVSHAYAEYSYVPNSHPRGDPFASPLDGEAPSPTPRCKPTDELCKVDLDSAKVTGLVTGQLHPLAMLEDASGRQVMVRVGTHVGPRQGRVTAIRAGSVEITEVMQTSTAPKAVVRKLQLEELPKLDFEPN